MEILFEQIPWFVGWSKGKRTTKGRIKTSAETGDVVQELAERCGDRLPQQLGGSEGAAGESRGLQSYQPGVRETQDFQGNRDCFVFVMTNWK